LPRPLRIQFPGAVYYVTNRGAGGRPIFEGVADAQDFLKQLEDVAVALGWRCYAYALTADRYHLVIETTAPNLSQGMQTFSGRYTQGFNRRHGREGALFRGRFKAILIERETQLAPLVRFVVLSPVLAGLVQDPAAWRWSSYRATAGMADATPLLDFSWMIGPYAFALPQARDAWRAHVTQGLADRAKVEAFGTRLKNRSILGDRDFVRATRQKARTEGAVI